jgi:hypothetical protein
MMPRAAGGLSGRPTCRIFPVGRLWVLQVDRPNGWLLDDGPFEPPPRLQFPTLGAAVAYAENHGYDYRVITPSPIARLPDRARRVTVGHGRQRRSALGQSNTEH